MQHLLDFVHEHTVEEQLYIVIDSPGGELEVTWQRRSYPEHWEVRPKQHEGPAELLHRRELLSSLLARNANMLTMERELHCMVATQIVFADMILRDARRLLGSDAVRDALQSYSEFVSLLQVSVRQLVAADDKPGLRVLSGEAAQTPGRKGHLTLVR